VAHEPRGLGSLIACSMSQASYIPIVRRRITSARTSHVPGPDASLLAPPSPSTQPQVVGNGACDALALFLGKQSTHAVYASLHQPEHDVEPEMVVHGPAARHCAESEQNKNKSHGRPVEFRRVIYASCGWAAIREADVLALARTASCS
jgi:hypothetical protein